MEDLTRLPNIGKDTQRQLYEIGITDYQTLKEIGSKEVWLRLKKIDPSACLLRLQGLEGAIRGIKKNDLPEEVKKDLKDFYNFHK